MKLRRLIFISCIFISVVLFINGLSVLALINKKGLTRPFSKHLDTQVKDNHMENSPLYRKPVNIIVLGLDEEEVRSDVILLLNFSPEKERLNILSIARDTRVRVGGKSAKINALVGMGGEILAIKKIEELTGLQVNYYVTLNFKGFRKMIDTLDGVEVNIPFDMDYDDSEQNLHIHLRKGRQVLNGQKAEQLVRYRKGNKAGEGYTDGDLGRIKMQQQFIKELIDQKIRIRYITKIYDVFYILKEYMKTNIELGDINYYLRDIRNLSYEKVAAFTLPGEARYVNHLWFFIPDKEKTTELLDKYFFK
ncbi:MAG: LCP family protein [Clostridia bacterium]|nr:LCP family protein [Clostridia bacterium]